MTRPDSTKRFFSYQNTNRQYPCNAIFIVVTGSTRGLLGVFVDDAVGNGQGACVKAKMYLTYSKITVKGNSESGFFDDLTFKLFKSFDQVQRDNFF